MEQLPQLLTSGDVRQRCRISKATMYRMLRRGEFPTPIRIGPRAVRWREVDVAKWLAGWSRGDGASKQAG